MTVSTSTNVQTYSITVSTSSVLFTLPLFTDADLTVIRQSAAGVETVLTRGADWTFAATTTDSNSPLMFPDGGTINLLSGPYTDGKIIARRDVAATQLTDFPLGGSLNSASIEAAFDKLTFLVQQVAEIQARSIQFPDGEVGVANTLPSVTDRASKFFGADSAGNLIAGNPIETSVIISSFGETLVAAANAAAARALFDALQNVVTTRGDVIRGDSSGNAERLALGTAGQAVISNGTDAVFGSPYGVVQVVSDSNTSYITTTATINVDDTIPQITEGTDLGVSVAITPTNASNIIIVDALIPIVTGSNKVARTLALFQDGAADAVAAAAANIPGTAGDGSLTQIKLNYEAVAGSTAEKVFTLRIGVSSSGTTYVNGGTSNRLYGGVSAIRLRATEIKVNG